MKQKNVSNQATKRFVRVFPVKRVLSKKSSYSFLVGDDVDMCAST